MFLESLYSHFFFELLSLLLFLHVFFIEHLFQDLSPFLFTLLAQFFLIIELLEELKMTVIIRTLVIGCIIILKVDVVSAAEGRHHDWWDRCTLINLIPLSGTSLFDNLRRINCCFIFFRINYSLYFF